MICTTTYLSCPLIKVLSPNDLAKRRYFFRDLHAIHECIHSEALGRKEEPIPIAVPIALMQKVIILH